MAGIICNDPNAWEEAKKVYGFNDEQRPAWVGAGAEASTKDAEAADITIEAPGSRKAPRTAVQGKLGQENNASLAGAAAALAGAPAGAAPQTAQTTALDAVNRALGPGGQRLEALGSNALQRWIQENAVR